MGGGGGVWVGGGGHPTVCGGGDASAGWESQRGRSLLSPGCCCAAGDVPSLSWHGMILGAILRLPLDAGGERRRDHAAALEDQVSEQDPRTVAHPAEPAGSPLFVRWSHDFLGGASRSAPAGSRRPAQRRPAASGGSQWGCLCNSLNSGTNQTDTPASSPGAQDGGVLHTLRRCASCRAPCVSGRARSARGRERRGGSGPALLRGHEPPEPPGAAPANHSASPRDSVARAVSSDLGTVSARSAGTHCRSSDTLWAAETLGQRHLGAGAGRQNALPGDDGSCRLHGALPPLRRPRRRPSLTLCPLPCFHPLPPFAAWLAGGTAMVT